MCIDIAMIEFGIVTHHFSKICTRIIALYLRQQFVPAQYLENCLNFYICIDIDKNWLRIVTRHLFEIGTRVMAFY